MRRKPAADSRGPTRLGVLVIAAMTAANAEPQLDRRGEAPPNPHAAGTVWSQFHRNGYAQSATPLRGPEPGDTVELQYLGVPWRGGTPTQMHVSDRYPDGSYTVWSTSLTHLIKARVNGEAFAIADAYEITPRAMAWNIHWNMQLAGGNKAFVPAPKDRAILRFGETDADDPMSPLELEDRFVLPEPIEGAPYVINLSYDGWLIYVTDQAWVGAVRQDFSEHRYLDLGKATGDVTTHNSFPVDEDGNIFIASFFALTKVNWDGDELRLVWRTPYEFRGPDCPPPAKTKRREVWKAITGKACTGSGTTPTLVGRDGMDELVVLVDSHRRNNLVAFWRNEPPADWTGLPGRDRRLAGVFELPHSTWEARGFTAENSPPVAGYDMAVAQYTGFRPPCRGPKGVQIVRWNPDERQLELAWANPEVAFNNVMTISTGSDLVYGSGRDQNCDYVYRGLDRATGAVEFETVLGRSGKFIDGGNSNVVLPDRSIVFGVNRGIVRLRVVK